MSILSSIRNFIATRPDERVMVVLHTSCVLEATDDLRSLAAMRDVKFTVANSVFYELQVLKLSSNMKLRVNADLILTHLCRFHALSCDTEEFYDSAAVHIDPVSIHGGPVIFAFYDAGAAEEFVLHTVTRDPGKLYLYFFDPYGYNRQYLIPQPLSAFSETELLRHPFRKVTPICGTDPCTVNPLFKSTLYLGRKNSFGFNRTVDGTRFKLLTGGIGGEAEVFTTPELPGRVIKIYTAFRPTDAKVEKLENLAELGRRIRSDRLAMPTDLLFDERNACLGFIMPQVTGEPLRNIILNESWNRFSRTAVIRNLSLLLLELRLYQINISDLSGNNVLIGRSNEVYIIDCDSFETFKHPGGGATPPYVHPDIDSALMFDRFREPYQINFSYAVLLFQCLLGWQNPLTQRNMGSEEPTWGTAEFPYEADNDLNAAPAKYARWMELNDTTRQAFADEFHFRRWHSVGAWIRALKL